MPFGITPSAPATIDPVDMPDADASTKGVIQLAGDLGGTAASPTVPGLASKQAADADLTALAAIDSTQVGTIGSTGSGWVARSWAQVKTALSLTKSDVGLGSVTNDEQVPKSLYDANTILKADSDNTPAALTVAASSIIGRLAAGGIAALSISDVLTLLGRTDEDVQDLVGGMVASNSETGIAVTYDDSGGKLDFSVDDTTKIAKSLVDAKGDLLVGTADNTVARKAVGSNGSALVADSSQSDGLAFEYSPQWFPTYKSGYYYFCNSNGGTSTTAPTNNQVRVSPWVVTKAITIVRLFAEFTVAGEANSIFRFVIYADDGSGQPTGSPILDPGSISTGSGNAGTVATGGTPGVYELTVSQALNPGLYWIGGVVQSGSTTAPTMRTCAAAAIPAPHPFASLPGTNSTSVGPVMNGVSGTPGAWSTSAFTSLHPRIGFKTA
jgi:hypothetical protein